MNDFKGDDPVASPNNGTYLIFYIQLFTSFSATASLMVMLNLTKVFLMQPSHNQ